MPLGGASRQSRVAAPAGRTGTRGPGKRPAPPKVEPPFQAISLVIFGAPGYTYHQMIPFKTLRVGIISREQYRARAIAIARGRYKPKRGEPKIWFEALRCMAQV